MATDDLPESQDAAPAASAAEPANDGEVLLDQRQAADFMGITAQRLNRLRRRGEIPAQRQGWRGWRFRQTDLMAHVERSAGIAAPAPSAEAAPEDGLPAWMAELVTPPPPAAKPVHDAANEAPLVRMANAILVTAIEQNASDIHIEPDRMNVRVRIRVDGELCQLMTMPKHIQARLTNRFKVMADVVLQKRNIPQLGSVPVLHAGQNYQIRVSVVPSMYGENIVMHILRSANIVPLVELGMSDAAKSALEGTLWSPNGLLLLTGPSGSGLTTTGACCLNRLNRLNRNICAIEDSPEYTLPGVMQTYYSALRNISRTEGVQSLLRQNPDVVFLGDIQDRESAQIAVDTALSGTLTIATVAAIDSIDAVRRLTAFGVDRSEVARALVGVCAQRLVRRLCPACKAGEMRRAYYFSSFGYEMQQSGEEIEIFIPRGCEECQNSGYRGRAGLFEILPFGEDLADLVARNASYADLRDAVRARGRIAFRSEAMLKMLAGETSLDEITRALHRVS